MNASVRSFAGRREHQASDPTAVRNHKARSQFPDDLPPTGEEARIQRTETVMPLVWAALGLLLAVLYSIALGMR